MAEQWQGRSRGGKTGYQIFIFLIRHCGIRAAYFLLFFVSLYFIAAAPSSTADIWRYARRILGYGRMKSALFIFRSYYSFGQSIIDKVAISSGLSDRYHYDFETVPQKLLWNCPEVKSASYMFGYCDSLVAFPEKFFVANHKIEDLGGFFSNCVALDTLPDDFLSYCPELVSLWQAFCLCESLETIPVSFFDNNRKLQDTQEMFFCCGLTGESPYTVIDGKKVHLYERWMYPDWFYPISKPYNRAFTGNDFIDQGTMPENWRY